jgi:transposase
MERLSPHRQPDPTDVSDAAGACAAPALTLMDPAAPQRRHNRREGFDARRWIVRAGAPWRRLPHEFPPWPAVSQQTQRWVAAGCFAAMAHDLRALLRWAAERADAPTAVVNDARPVQSTPESGGRAGCDGHKERRGSKAHAAVDPPGHRLALRGTPANAPERDPVATLAARAPAVTGAAVEVASVAQGATGPHPAAAAAAHGLRLEAVKRPETKQGVVLLPRRWVGERTCAWAARFRRLARDDERLPAAVAALHCAALTCLMLHRLVTVAAQSP